MIMNWKEEITKIDPDIKFRAQGGWLKTVEELDKSVTNGYSLVGDFVKAGDFEGEYLEGIYLDCDLVIDAQKNWAQDFWDAVEDEIEIIHPQI